MGADAVLIDRGMVADDVERCGGQRGAQLLERVDNRRPVLALPAESYEQVPRGAPVAFVNVDADVPAETDDVDLLARYAVIIDQRRCLPSARRAAGRRASIDRSLAALPGVGDRGQDRAAEEIR